MLQLTGALVDREGRAIRIGAEGLLARRTNLLLSAVGVQATISDDGVERIRTAAMKTGRDSRWSGRRPCAASSRSSTGGENPDSNGSETETEAETETGTKIDT